jgi:hypothetical protein
MLMLSVAVVLAGCGDDPVVESGASSSTATTAGSTATPTTFVPVLPEPTCIESFAENLDRQVAGIESWERERFPGPYAAIDGLRAADIGGRWDAADVCITSTGDGSDAFNVGVVDGTLPDDLREAALAAAPGGTLVIEDLVWEGTPEPAEWGFATDEVVGPETTSFDVLIHEGACSSGRSAEGRIPPPTIEYNDNTVHVKFIVYTLPGMQTCPGPPPTPYTVTLREPLGDRELTGNVEVDPQYINPP